MNTDQVKGEKDELVQVVLGAVFEVANYLGSGFLEKVYERALLHKLKLRGIAAEGQVSLAVRYKDIFVGNYLADLVVDGQLMVELKCVDQFAGGIWHSA